MTGQRPPHSYPQGGSGRPFGEYPPQVGAPGYDYNSPGYQIPPAYGYYPPYPGSLPPYGYQPPVFSFYTFFLFFEVTYILEATNLILNPTTYPIIHHFTFNFIFTVFEFLTSFWFLKIFCLSHPKIAINKNK